MKFAIASHNLALSLGPPIVFNGAHARALRVADAFYAKLKDVDVIFLQELVVHRQQVLNTYINHPYHTRKVTSNIFSKNIRFLSSGLAIVSSWPIVKQRSHVFTGETYHMETFMAKSILYAKIVTPVGYVHVLNTHVNAWTAPKAVLARESQAQQIGAFVKSLEIPTSEPVFLGGDLNMDIYEHGNVVDHISKLAGGFRFYKPKEVAFSSDPLLNTLVGTDDADEYASRSMLNGCIDDFLQTGQCLCCPRQLLDMIGTLTTHQLPSNVVFNVIPVKTRAPFAVHINLTKIKLITDVSDHFPVILRMTLDEDNTIITPEGLVEIDHVPATQPSLGWSVIIILFSVTYFIILLTLSVAFYKLGLKIKSIGNKNKKN
jgi:endonuclease/exonuclease/phosphatase family metal-dependent hydrolase